MGYVIFMNINDTEEFVELIPENNRYNNSNNSPVV